MGMAAVGMESDGGDTAVGTAETMGAAAVGAAAAVIMEAEAPVTGMEAAEAAVMAMGAAAEAVVMVTERAAVDVRRACLWLLRIVCAVTLNHLPPIAALASTTGTNPVPHALPCNVDLPAPVHRFQNPKPHSAGGGNDSYIPHVWKPAVSQYSASAQKRGYDACRSKRNPTIASKNHSAKAEKSRR